jgi:hypothetical protein
MRRKEALLFEKRSKNFCSLAYALRQRVHHGAKVFWFLFLKKNAFLAGIALDRKAPGQR